MVGGTYHILSGPAESVDRLGDVAVQAADHHVVLFGVDGGDEGQEGGEEEAHGCAGLCFVGLVVWCGVVWCGVVVIVMELPVTIKVMLDRGSKGGGCP